ncbi:helix-turn-helix domain-containing protein [Micromonospora sp. NPDC005203]|uniref:helix-turn-helix domain-containing protein n=1 Tax=Micromonospora sp. NPDC005203 TaxID=3364226 RepID=UPI0036B72599
MQLDERSPPVTHANCPRCGGRLARDNDSGRCTPCQAAERDRLSAPPVVPQNFWDHEPVRQALAERHLGRVIRAYRCHPYHGRVALPQSMVAGWLGITQAQLSRVENGPPLVHLDRLAHWAQLLGIPASCLWFGLPRQPYRADDGAAENLHAHDRMAEQGEAPAIAVTVEGASTRGGGATDRRRFNAMAALAGLAAAGHPYLLTDPANVPRNIGMEQVRLASSLVQDFRRADAAAGADLLCDVAVQAHVRLSTWAAEATYSREVGDALQSALADLGIQAAWLATDAERRREARPYLNEAIARARIADDPRMEVQALTQLSMLLRESQPGESLHCAEAALRVSARWATPRLTTLLHLRRAHTYAVLTDASGFSREMTKARRELERGPHEDDLGFVDFVNEQEVHGIQGLSYLALDKPNRAAQSFRAIIANPSPGHRRNQVYYTVHLSEAAYQQGDVNEAARIALDVLPAVSQMNSGRISRHLAQVRSNLAASPLATTATRQFVAAYDRAVSV